VTNCVESRDKSQAEDGFSADKNVFAAFSNAASLVQILRLPTPMPSPKNRIHTSSRMEIALGRSMAVCAHPVAAWRVLSGRGRFLLASFYGAVSYVSVLAALLILK
jgi:hypothetical protein